jgi:hypothetical protein
VHKKDINEWLERIDERELTEHHESFDRHDGHESLEGSKLIDKYNQLLMEYGHRL